MNKHKVMITGAAGYIGSMLLYKYAMRDDVEKILAIDKDPETDFTKNIDILYKSIHDIDKLKSNDVNMNVADVNYRDKIVYLQANLANDNWIMLAEQIRPDIIVHTAWQIREIYGRRDVSWLYNIVASDKVFDFTFEHVYVKRLIHFSTVASYGALPTNTLDYRYKEDDKFRETVYLYAEEKRIAEDHLASKYTKYIDRVLEESIFDISLQKQNTNDRKMLNEENRKQIMIVRPASITGPRLRNEINKFSLQSALSGNLKKQKGFLNKLVGHMTSFMPSTHGWLRQYIHEDDVIGIVSHLSFAEHDDEYAVYNLCPPGDVVLAPQMAKALGKRAINISPRLIQAVFALFWHMTRGRVPTAPGVWSGYSYPIGVDGSKISKIHNYKYKYESLDALTTDKGDFAKS